MPKLFLFDAMSLVFRAYHAMSRSGLTAPNGEPTGAVFGFANMLATILNKEQPEYASVVFDTSGPTFRHEKYPEYKANRPDFPEELVPQLARIKELLRHLNINQCEQPGFEADDIIGTLTRQAAAHDVDVYCVTSDKDYYQLVTDRVRLYKPTSGNTGEYELIDFEGVHKKFGVSPDKVIDVLAIMGDSVDNVPGIKGVGEKTAIPLVQEFGTLEEIYANLDKITRKSLHKKFVEHRDMAFLSKELVTIHTSMDMEWNLEKLHRGAPDKEALLKLFSMLNFRRTIPERFGLLDGGAADESTREALDASAFKTIEDSKHEYILVDSKAKLDAMLAELEKATVLAFDTETTGVDAMRCDIVGISFSYKAGKAWYVPLFRPEKDFSDGAAFARQGLQEEDVRAQDSLFAGKADDPQGYTHSRAQARAVLRFMEPILTAPHIAKIGQNAKYDLLVLKRYGINVYPIGFDTMLASYVLDSSQKHGMDLLSRKWLQYSPVSITSLIGEKKKDQKQMNELPVAEVMPYACEDADVTFQLYTKMQPALEEQKLEELARRTEFELVEALGVMEYNGIGLDKSVLEDLSDYVSGEIERIRKEIIAETGGAEFNIDSTKQLGAVLFEKMQLPVVKKTKTGYSTDSTVLEELAPSYPIADMILEYRQYTKLKSTYIDALPKLVNPETGRIHTTYNQTVASTGRLSSIDPNLQNIPIRTELGRKIRTAFIPQAEGAKILSVDYSQIELRVMAHLCGDETLTDAFRHGRDIHAATAANLFGVALENVDAEMRRRAKTVNFGLMYGLGTFGLAQRLGIPRGEAKEIIDSYFAKYPRIKEFIDGAIKSAHEKGYAETLLGRRRYFPDIHSRNRVLRTAAERAAINMPIQGTAADMLKLAMVSIHRAMQERGMRSLMMLQVHDELVFEMVPEESDSLPELVAKLMAEALPLGEVPVEASIGIGDNWAEAH